MKCAVEEGWQPRKGVMSCGEQIVYQTEALQSCELLANKNNFDRSGNIDNKTLDKDNIVIM